MITQPLGEKSKGGKMENTDPKDGADLPRVMVISGPEIGVRKGKAARRR